MSRKGKFGGGRHPSKFSFTYEDYADIFGCSVEAARKHAQRGNYDPNDIMSILEFMNKRLRGKGADESSDLSGLLERIRHEIKRK